VELEIILEGIMRRTLKAPVISHLGKSLWS